MPKLVMERLQLALAQIIKDLYNLDFNPKVFPSKLEGVDYSSNAPLELVKILHRPPMEIANEIQDYILKLTKA